MAMENKMQIKEVRFEDIDMLGVKNDKGVFVSIKSICNSLGVDNSSQLKRIKRDETLSKGVVQMTIPTNRGSQTVSMLSIDFLPLWVVGFTTNKVKEEVRRGLTRFKLKAKDVLAEAFLANKVKIPKTYAEALLEAGRLALENEKLEAKIEEQKPMVEYVEQIAESKDSVSLGTFAKLINDRDNISIGRNKLFKLCKKNKLIQEDNIPYQKYIDNGYFEVKQWTKETMYGRKIGHMALITPIGQVKMLSKIKGWLADK